MTQAQFERFDMVRKARSASAGICSPLPWLMSYPAVWMHRVRITKINIDGLKPPDLLLCNHNAFMDFKVTTAAIFPQRANYVVAIDGFIRREWLLRNVGCICKRKFTNDPVLIKHLGQVIRNGDVAVLYPRSPVFPLRHKRCASRFARKAGKATQSPCGHAHHARAPSELARMAAWGQRHADTGHACTDRKSRRDHRPFQR